MIAFGQRRLSTPVDMDDTLWRIEMRPGLGSRTSGVDAADRDFAEREVMERSAASIRP
jgi:hypothetical protein